MWRKLPAAADLASAPLVKGRSGKLTELILARLPGRASLSIVIVTALIVAVLIAAAFFLPAQFMNVLWGNGSPAPAASAATVPAVAATPAKPALAATVKPQAARAISGATPAAASAAPKTAGDVIANTFQTIFAGPNGPSLEQSAPTRKPGAALAAALPTTTSAPRPAPADGKGVVTRLVDTLVIHADPKTGAIEMPADNAAPQPGAAPAVAPAQAAAASAPDDASATPEAAPIPLAPPPALAARATPPAPSIVADAKPASAEAATPAAPAKSEPAAAASEFAIVGGRGVTVRSGPATAHGTLFTLAAGKKVAVSGEEHGWLHITDAEGRAGWIYSGLVKITKD